MTGALTGLPRLKGFARRLSDNVAGVAMIEFAMVLPILVVMCLTGAELTNYITAKLRVSQLALHLADDAARVGAGSQLAAKQLNENDINDLFIGAQMQSGALDLRTNGRVVLSSLEPVANPNPTNKFRIRWQRCYGLKTAYTPAYGRVGHASGLNMDGMGPAGRQVTAQEDNATMFVEVFYTYQPLVGLGTQAPSTTFVEIASMAVRDRRDTTDDTVLPNGTTNPNPQHPNGVYKVAGVTPSTC